MSDILKDYKEIRMIENIKNAKNYLKQIKELQKENEELEIQLKILETLSSPKILTNETLNIIMMNKAQKYETALEEIMEIVNTVEYYCELPKYTGKIKDIINKALESEEK